MKKRILALALAGTTAFSVFGAAMSASAAMGTDNNLSSQIASTNDIYKHYTPVAYTVTSRYTGAEATYKIRDLNKSGEDADWQEETYTEAGIDGYVALQDTVEDFTKESLYGAFGTLMDPATGKIATFADNSVKYDDPEWNTLPDVVKNGFHIAPANGTGSEVKYTIDYAGDGTVDFYADTLVEALKKAMEVDAPSAWKGHARLADGSAAITDAEYALLKTAAVYKSNILKELVSEGDASSTFTVKDRAGNVIDVKNFVGSTSADTTIYPWTTTTKYVTSDGVIEVNEAVTDETLYLFDFIPYNKTTASSSAIANAYNYVGKAAAAKEIGNDDWTAETGKGGSYGIRAEVVSEFEDFLAELVIPADGHYKLSRENFKEDYVDLLVTGYRYDEYTGNVKGWWTADLYNLEELLDDIYDMTVVDSNDTNGKAYLTANTSEMLYLMQQYDKYVGDYIDRAEADNTPWGDLLLSILESATEADFKKPADYKAYAREVEDLRDAYEDAETNAMVEAVVERMYAKVVATKTKTSGVGKDEATSLSADLYGLYFNINYLPENYTTANATRGHAALKDYAYLQGVTLLDDRQEGSGQYTDTYNLYTSLITSPGYYSLYPQYDYYEYNNVIKNYAGVDVDFGVGATDEYEWFLNVYHLAAEVNASSSKNVTGIVAAVNDALNEAVEALTVTRPAYATEETALEEMIETYEDELDGYVKTGVVSEEDYKETYYAAYEAALAYAEVAEGAAQVANARYMVEVSAKALTYQGAQETITKNDIKVLQASIADGNAALKAIKDDANYNAAQVNALNKALATANSIVEIFNGTAAGYNKVNKSTAAYIGDKDAIVKSDLTSAIEAINAAIDYSEIIMGWNKTSDGWTYGTEDAYLNDGWHFIDKVWYYFDEDATAKQSEWAKIDGTWYYFNSNAGAARGWCKVENEWYYFDQNTCAMKTGWVKVDGNWYYLAASGKMTTGWVQVGGKWYYMSKESNSLGQMLANTTVEGYKLGADGAMIEK